MSTIPNLYQKLYEQLKGDGLEYLIQRIKEGSFSDSEKEALRIIARLPHPSFANLNQIIDVCKECSRRYLEFAFSVGQIGEIALQILKKVNEYKEEGRSLEIPRELPPSPDVYNFQSIGEMVRWTNTMMLHIARQTDIILKGRCPHCHGDLVEVIVDNELRLRCQQQSKPECRRDDWFLQNVTPKTP